MRLQLLDEATWVATTEDGRMAVVPAVSLHTYLDKECPGGSGDWQTQRLQCAGCKEIWVDLRSPEELFTKCHSCGMWLTLDRQKWALN